MLKILIADDHAIVRKGLTGLLREEFPTAKIQEATNGAEVIKKVHQEAWDLILLDICMPDMNGIEALKQLRSEEITIPVLILSMHPEDQYAVRVLKAGASGFLNKDVATEGLINAVHVVLSGRKYIPASIAEMVIDSMNSKNNTSSNYEKLSDREMQVFKLIAAGKTVSEIAQLMYLSSNTISTYRSRILEKMSIQNNSELTRYAFENSLI